MLLISPHSASIRESIYDIASIVAQAKNKKYQSTLISARILQLSDDRWSPSKTSPWWTSCRMLSSSQLKVALPSQSTRSNKPMTRLRFARCEIRGLVSISNENNIRTLLHKKMIQRPDNLVAPVWNLAISTQLVELMGGQFNWIRLRERRLFYSILSCPLIQHCRNQARLLPNIYILGHANLLSERIDNELKLYGLDVAQTTDSTSTWLLTA